jgi:hypothetical protein
MTTFKIHHFSKIKRHEEATKQYELGFFLLLYLIINWRGFVSPVGSARPKNKHTAYMNTHRGGGGKLRGYPVNVGQGRGNRYPPPYYRRN